MNCVIVDGLILAMMTIRESKMKNSMKGCPEKGSAQPLYCSHPFLSPSQFGD